VKTYEPRNFRSKTSLNPKDVEANREWIRHWAKKKGALVVDIGNDPDPTTTPSAFYEVEKRSLGRWAADVDVVKYNPGF
jgi:hypothetical protein